MMFKCLLIEKDPLARLQSMTGTHVPIGKFMKYEIFRFYMFGVSLGQTLTQ